MQESELKAYRNLQQHLDKQPIGYPATESGIELKVLKHLFTPEEADIASEMNYLPEKLKQIYRRLKKTGLTINELEEKLDTMDEKGTIARIENKGLIYYVNIPFVIGIYENQLGHLTKEFYNDVDDYKKEYFEGAYNTTAVPQLRVIPIEESITPEQSIANYDLMRTVIEKSDGVIGIMECICRQGKDLIGESCKKSDLREVCFAFRSSAIEMHKRGEARLINKEEALSILKKVEEAGFVLQPDNSQRPAYMCSCCGCCCGVLVTQKKFNQPAKLFVTNFYAEVDSDLCIGCGTCEERCNLEAITLDSDVAEVDLDRCIGCGVCVPTCTQEAMSLKKKEQEISPPRSTGVKTKLIMEKKAEKARLEKT